MADLSPGSSGGAEEGGKYSPPVAEGRIKGLGPILPAPKRRILRTGRVLLLPSTETEGNPQALSPEGPSMCSAEVMLSPPAVIATSLKTESMSETASDVARGECRGEMAWRGRFE